MAKTRTQHVCQQCGRTAPKALGRCPQCGAWNSMVEELLEPRRPASSSTSLATPLQLHEIDGADKDRISLSIEEFSRVLGGGVVPGSLVLIGGDPGIGKSTLLLQLGASVAGKVLYVSGEESLPQIKARAARIADDRERLEQLYLVSETDLERVISQMEDTRPQLVVIDSIQTMRSPAIESGAGSISQVRESAARLQAVAKSSGIAVFLVGHVTKEGSIAGPRVLEHIVDTVLYLEGDAYHSYRLLRSVKNRFGATTEVGVFEMTGIGLREVQNPSEAFLAERREESPGSAIAVTLEGTRPLLVEVQGLTSYTAFGHPRRTSNGIDHNRLLLITAVLARRVGLQLSDQDVFVNVVGGLQIREPAADLPIAAAIFSSAKDQSMPPDLALIGEVGLSGELRSVPRLGERLIEASKLGFRQAIIPASRKADVEPPKDLALHRFSGLREALEHALR
jgi:DNA repair protein RadA/Sms